MICGPLARLRWLQIRFWLLLAAGSSVALLLASPLGSAPSGQDLAGVIAFTRADGIYAMRPDGSGVHALRRGGVAAGALDLAWSPDGRRLAFATWGGIADVGGIWVMNADGSSLRRLVEVATDWARSPSWSPDGRRLVYTTSTLGRKPPGRLWVMKADSSSKRLLAELARIPLYALTDINWSPRGDRVAFTTGGWVSELYVLDLDGGLRKLSNTTTYVFEPRWSPDGRRIAFTSAPGASAEEIAVTSVDGDVQARFLTDNRVYDGEPAWSPDGRRIAFVRGEEELCSLGCAPFKRSTHEIYLMNADGTGVTRLTHNGIGEGSPAWQPPHHQ